jgi:two-component system, cell cycle sensor histidine kinase and response regulator CckA
MPTGGVLTISAENITLDENYALMTPGAAAGGYVKIMVEDSGEGIVPEVRERIFEPFFTTKDVGEGTGLGLSTALAIVKSHNGFINVYSEAGRGSSFAVYLPAADGSEDESLEKQVDELPVGSGQLILVVDDEEAVREITKGTLETFGYRVLTAADGTEAVAIYAQKKDEIAVVITDMMMPFMDGLPTIRSLKRLKPTVKVISASGLANDAKAKEAAELGVEMFLPKPYTAELLLRALAEII